MVFMIQSMYSKDLVHGGIQERLVESMLMHKIQNLGLSGVLLFTLMMNILVEKFIFQNKNLSINHVNFLQYFSQALEQNMFMAYLKY